MLSSFRLALMLLPVLMTTQAVAEDWPVRITPESIVLEADEDDELVQEIVFINAEDWPLPVRLEAVNWAYGATGIRVFGSDTKVANDCRQWWTAGSADLLIQPNGTAIYAMKIRVPDDMDEWECHFALAVIPVSGEGRYATRYLPVYINVEGAEADLEFDSLVMHRDAAGNKQPMVVIKNAGTARSKIYGMLEGEDAQGQDLDLVVRSTEILAGETRAIPLLVSREDGGEIWWSAPLEIEGTLIWDQGEIDVEGVLR